MSAARPKYPAAGDVYRSAFYPGELCKVVRVLEAQVAFQWLGRYAHIEEQTAPVSRFVIDFSQ